MHRKNQNLASSFSFQVSVLCRQKHYATLDQSYWTFMTNPHIFVSDIWTIILNQMTKTLFVFVNLWFIKTHFGSRFILQLSYWNLKHNSKWVKWNATDTYFETFKACPSFNQYFITCIKCYTGKGFPTKSVGFNVKKAGTVMKTSNYRIFFMESCGFNIIEFFWIRWLGTFFKSADAK